MYSGVRRFMVSHAKATCINPLVNISFWRHPSRFFCLEDFFQDGKIVSSICFYGETSYGSVHLAVRKKKRNANNKKTRTIKQPIKRWVFSMQPSLSWLRSMCWHRRTNKLFEIFKVGLASNTFISIGTTENEDWCLTTSITAASRTTTWCNPVVQISTEAFRDTL